MSGASLCLPASSLTAYGRRQVAGRHATPFRGELGGVHRDSRATTLIRSRIAVCRNGGAAVTMRTSGPDWPIGANRGPLGFCVGGTDPEPRSSDRRSGRRFRGRRRARLLGSRASHFARRFRRAGRIARCVLWCPGLLPEKVKTGLFDRSEGAHTVAIDEERRHLLADVAPTTAIHHGRLGEWHPRLAP
jgi:hypothetical protein